MLIFVIRNNRLNTFRITVAPTVGSRQLSVPNRGQMVPRNDSPSFAERVKSIAAVASRGIIIATLVVAAEETWEGLNYDGSQDWKTRTDYADVYFDHTFVRLVSNMYYSYRADGSVKHTTILQLSP